MDNGTLVAANHNLDTRPGVRRALLVAVLAVVLSMFVLMQRPADAAPSVGGGAGVSAQFNPTQQICATLFALRASYAGNPFFAPAVAAIDQQLVAFGCIPGPTTTTTRPPTTTTTIPPTTTTTTVVVPPRIPLATTCATLLATRAAFVGTPFAVFIPFIDIAIVAAGCFGPS